MTSMTAEDVIDNIKMVIKPRITEADWVFLEQRLYELVSVVSRKEFITKIYE